MVGHLVAPVSSPRDALEQLRVEMAEARADQFFFARPQKLHALLARALAVLEAIVNDQEKNQCQKR